MRTDLLTKYGGLVPRYTSYPTAPHFCGDVGAATYGRWLRAIDQAPSVSLYFHVPFCAHMCWYCGCHTKIAARYDPIARYAKHLALELELIARSLGQPKQVSHVHWGGGTPTSLTSEDFATLMMRLRTQFVVSPNAEVAVEMDPRTLTRDMIETMAANGVTRASLGIQDVDPDVQEAINRVQPLDLIRSAVSSLRDTGIRRISFDLMYGLPLQTDLSVRRTVDTVVSMDPDRLSVFGYAHVPWMKRHQRLIDMANAADADGRMAQADAIADRLEKHGYQRIGLDHFARPGDPLTEAQAAGTLRRNFQGYTTDTASALIGLGASAISQLQSGYAQNETSIGRYEAAITNGQFATVRGVEISREDRVRSRIIESLMCKMQVDPLAVAADLGLMGHLFGSEYARLKDMETDGILRFDGSRIILKDAGRPFVRAVASIFDSYLDAGKAKHSQAV